jgi:hypothetical protein
MARFSLQDSGIAKEKAPGNWRPLVCHALLLGLATTAVMAIGCGSNDSGNGPSDGASEAASPDSTPSDGPGEASAPLDGGSGGSDATVGRVLFAVEASLQTTIVGGTCAAASSLVATPDETAVGQIIILTASGLGPGNQSSGVTLTWTASGGVGSLSNGHGPSNAFSCASVGKETVAVTAAISDGGASCAKTGTLTVTLTCDRP